MPRIECKKCGQAFSTQWASKPDDLALPRGAVVSERFELARNFCNKLWNASRFALMNLEGYSPGPVQTTELAVEDRWILSRLATVTARRPRRWRISLRRCGPGAVRFCLERVLQLLCRDGERPAAGPGRAPAAQRVLAHALDTLLRLLHPMVPFMTEEVWQLLGQAAPQRGLTPQRPAESMMIASWPEADAARQDARDRSPLRPLPGGAQGACARFAAGRTFRPRRR